MFIEIEDNITGILHDPNHGDFKEVVAFLHEIAICMKRGKHHVFIPSLRSDKNLKSAIKRIFSEEIYKILILADTSDSPSIKGHLKWYMRVAKTAPHTTSPNILNFNPLHNHQLEIFEETHLICENLYDCDLYGRMAEAYCHANHLPQNNINFLPRNGGGATIGRVVRNEIKNQNHLCLIITDSDKKYTTDPKFGDTYKAVASEVAADPYAYVHLHVMRNSREAENLLPHRLLLMYLPQKPKKLLDFINTCQDYTAYFDFKEGLHFKDLNDDTEFRYWMPALDRLKINYKKQTQYKKLAKSKKTAYHTLVQTEPNFISGFGKRILPTILTNHWKDLKKQDYRQLTATQRLQWEEIGELVYNWTLSKTYI